MSLLSSSTIQCVGPGVDVAVLVRPQWCAAVHTHVTCSNEVEGFAGPSLHAGLSQLACK